MESKSFPEGLKAGSGITVTNIVKTTHPEYVYLFLVQDVIGSGTEKKDRTAVGTICKFGEMMKFDISNEFPLLTTKKMYWKGIVEELLWFIRGDTNSKSLSEKGVKIWEANGSREFLDSRGLKDNVEGDLGPIYGFQWRHFGAEYAGINGDYNNKGIDQLKECIRLIKTDPTSRRIILSAWNPVDIHKMALPPCHILCQFQVTNLGNKMPTLNCLMFQRSCDMGLGVPFNIASYALLTYIIAHSCNLMPGELSIMMGDVHVYSNHIEQLKEQMVRKPYPWPKLIFKCNPKDVELYTIDDFELKEYKCHPSIKMDMAV